MHSFILLTLASSVFAIPVGNQKARDVVSAPVKAFTPVAAVVDAAANVVAPVKAAVANVDAKYVNAANDVASGNKVHVRDVVHAPVNAFAPAKAVADVYANVVAPVKAAVGNVNADYVNAANKVASGNNVNIRDVVNAPVKAAAPVDALADACADVAAPVKAAVGNVNADNVNAANGVASGNDIHLRDAVHAPVDVFAPVAAAVNAAAKVVAPVDAAVGNVNLDNVNALNGVASGNTINVRDVVGTPVKAFAPAGAAIKAAADIVAPVKAAVGNVNADYVNAANHVASGNHITL